MFCSLVIFIKNFDSINIRRPWAPEITMFCSEFIMTKTFKPIKTRRQWPPILFHIFFSKACFSSWLLLFLHLGYFWLDSFCTSKDIASWKSTIRSNFVCRYALVYRPGHIYFIYIFTVRLMDEKGSKDWSPQYKR